MLKIYYRERCGSSHRALSWFEKYNIELQKQQVNKIARSDLLKLLRLSDEGLKDIVKYPGKSGTLVKEALNYMEHLSFNDALEFLTIH